MGVFGMRAGESEAIVSRCLVHRPSASAVHVDMTKARPGSARTSYGNEANE